MSGEPTLVVTQEGTNAILKDSLEKGQTVQDLAFLLHITHVKALREKINNELASLKERQEKIHYIHEILQDINNAMDDKGCLDLTNNDDLRAKIEDARSLGIKIPVDSATVTETDANGKIKGNFQAHEVDRVIQNLNYSIDDWDREDGIQMRKAQNLYTESEQSIMIAKNTASSCDKALRAMISGIKG